MNNAFIFPNFVVDKHLRALSEEELKALVVCYRFNTNPTNENLLNFGLSSDVLDDALEKVGITTEAKAKSLIKEMASEYADAIETLWHWGDGKGGGLLDIIAEELGLVTDRVNSQKKEVGYKKKTISHSLRKRVFERDKYRCVSCGTHLDLTCDHIYPESKGGETTLENLQTMCRSCNSRKGTKVLENAL